MVLGGGCGAATYFVMTGAWQIAGDVTWTINPRTVAEIHGDWHDVINDPSIDADHSRILGPILIACRR